MGSGGAKNTTPITQAGLHFALGVWLDDRLPRKVGNTTLCLEYFITLRRVLVALSDALSQPAP